MDPITAILAGEVGSVPAPVWMPWPLRAGWTFAGLAHSEDVPPEEAGTVTCWLGVDPFGEPAELVLVSEEAGAGVGGLFAGLPVSYPGTNVGEGPPHARFTVLGRPVLLWAVDGPDDRGVYAGEAAGRWLWVVVHPAEASALVVQPFHLVDARRLGPELTTVPVGELSPRLVIG